MAPDSIEREIRIDAPPEVVYRVVSEPEQLRQWWPDDVDLDPVPGATGSVTFGDPGAAGVKVVALTVVEADPPHRFAFRWTQPGGEAATPANSLLVTFELVAAGAGTLLRFRETGFVAAASPERDHREHVSGWDHFLPRLVAHVGQLRSPR